MQQKTKIDIVQLIKRDTLWLSARFHKTLKKEAILFKNHSEISKWQLIQNYLELGLIQNVALKNQSIFSYRSFDTSLTSHTS